MDQRTDRLTALQVDLAVNIAAVFGLAAGVLSLHQIGAPLPVIQRVLIQGGPRRGSSSSTPESSSHPTSGLQPETGLFEIMMIRTIKYAIYGIMAASAFSHPVHAKTSVEAPSGSPRQGTTRPLDALQALRNAETQREDAMARGDVELLKSLFSDYYYHVESNGRVRSKTQLLKAVQRGELKFSSYKVDDVEIRLGGLVAVTIGRFTVTREEGRDKRQYSGRFMRVWERDGNRWRNTMHQSTELRPAAADAPGVVPTQ